MEKKCTCGGKLILCTLNAGMYEVQGVTVQKEYNFPKSYFVNAYMCELCGKIELYADKKD